MPWVLCPPLRFPLFKIISLLKFLVCTPGGRRSHHISFLTRSSDSLMSLKTGDALRMENGLRIFESLRLTECRGVGAKTNLNNWLLSQGRRKEGLESSEGPPGGSETWPPGWTSLVLLSWVQAPPHTKDCFVNLLYLLLGK